MVSPKKKRDSVLKGRKKTPLACTIVSAEGLAKADTFGKSDPFVKVLVNGAPSVRTQVIKKTLSPVWNEKHEIIVPLEPLESDIVVFDVFDHDIVGSNDFLGRVQFSGDALAAIVAEGASPRAYELHQKSSQDGAARKKKSKNVKGKLTLAFGHS